MTNFRHLTSNAAKQLLQSTELLNTAVKQFLIKGFIHNAKIAFKADTSDFFSRESKSAHYSIVL